MKIKLFPLLLLGLCATAFADDSFLVASYNIRYQNPEDVARGDGWETRQPQVAGLIRFHEFDVFGLQEVTAAQLQDLVTLDDYAHVGVGREDGKEAGEYSPVFWRKSRFALLDSGTFWLSPTPDIVSRGWDALYSRICTWVKLRDRRTGVAFHFWNTHFDHRGAEARKNSAMLLLARMKPHLGGREPVILLGDFNSTPDTEAYAILAAGLGDAMKLSAAPAYGPTGSTNGFNYNGKFVHRIDHIFLGPGIKVLKHGTLTDSSDHRFPSDHFPVVARLVLPK